MNQKMRKLIIYRRFCADCVSRKEERRNLACSEDGVDASTSEHNDFIKKTKEILTTAVNKNINKTNSNRKSI